MRKEPMPMANLNIRVEQELKNQTKEIFEALGLTMSAAVGVFLRQVVRSGGMPFAMKVGGSEITPTETSEGCGLGESKKERW
jgi:DNA-damage-inducible protein J